MSRVVFRDVYKARCLLRTIPQGGVSAFTEEYDLKPTPPVRQPERRAGKKRVKRFELSTSTLAR